MESNTHQDPAALALQIQVLTANMEELTKQNQEIRLLLQQEDNRLEINWDIDGDNQKRRPGTLEGATSDLLREMRKEMDELRNAIKEKID